MLKLSFSWDDGALEDLHLVRLLEKYEIPATLFIPTENKEGRKVLSPSDIKSVHSELIAIGAHTQHHTYLTELPLDKVHEEVVLNKKYLEDVLGISINDFSFPGGKYNRDIFSIIQNEFQTYRTADTMCSHLNKYIIKPTFHFYPRGKKSLLANALRHKDALFFECIKNMLRTDDYFELLRFLMDAALKSQNVFFIHIWGHSWELVQFSLWQELDKMLNWISVTCKNDICKYPNPYLWL